MAEPLSNGELLQHLAYHIFLPPELPQAQLGLDADQQVSRQITRSVIDAVSRYKKNDSKNVAQWDRVTRMLEKLFTSIEVPLEKKQLSQDITNLRVNDILALYIRAQNAAIIIRKRANTTIFEAFEVQAAIADVMSTPGKLLQQYPGPVVELPKSMADDPDFITEISNILTRMDTETFEVARPTTVKAGRKVNESRDSTEPDYFIHFFFGFLRGMGEVIDPPRVVKRVADEVLWKDAAKPWRRSPIWLIIRVAIQTTLNSKLLYKYFLAVFHIDILSQCLKQDAFPGDLLFVMRVKMARRLYKLKDFVPKHIVDSAAAVAENVQKLLQKRWSQIQNEQGRLPEWDPSTFDHDSAIYQTLSHSRGYIERVFHKRSNYTPPSSFAPKHEPRLEGVKDFSKYADGNLAKAFSTL